MASICLGLNVLIMVGVDSKILDIIDFSVYDNIVLCMLAVDIVYGYVLACFQLSNSFYQTFFRNSVNDFPHSY